MTPISNIIELIRGLNKLIKSNYVNQAHKSRNHQGFIDSSQELLFSYLNQQVDDGLVYLVLSYLKNNKTVVSENSYKFGKAASQSFQSLIPKYLSEIQQGKFPSFTKVLLKNNEGFDVIFEKGEKYTGPIKDADNDGVKFFDLDNLKSLKEYETGQYLGFVSESQDIEKYHSLLSFYERFTNEISKTGNIEGVYFHFLRPYFMELDYNILVGIGTTKKITPQLLGDVNNFAVRIASQMSKSTLEYEKELEELRNKSVYSLQTHSLKTMLKNSIIRAKNDVCEYIEKGGEEYHYLANDLDEEVECLFHLAGITSLLEKIDNKTAFIESGFNDELLTNEHYQLNLQEEVQKHNDRFPGKHAIVLKINGELPEFSFKIHNHYMSRALIRTFLFTLIENIKTHGAPENISGSIHVNVSFSNEDGWNFSNKMKSEHYYFDETQLRGNLGLFYVLFEKTNSGIFELDGSNYDFKLKIKNE